MKKAGLINFTAALLVIIPATHLPAQGPPPTLVTTEMVTSLEFHDQLTLIGRTEAKVHSRIVSEVSGRVTSIDAEEGNAIAQGQSLVTVDQTQLDFALRAKQAEEKEARVQAELAGTNLERVEELSGQKLVSETTVDSARAWVNITAARFERLRAEREKLAHDLENCVIKAPYSGYTLHRLVDVGEWVSPGTPVYEMLDLSEMKVTVDLPERYFGQVDIGSQTLIQISGDTANPMTGTVTGIARSASNETHTFPVMVTISNPDGKLGGGKLVRATLFLREVFTSMAVSKDAIVRDGLQTTVYTVADNKAVPVAVRTSSTRGNKVAVTGEGLFEGMPVVVRGNERIFPGAPLKLADSQQAGPPTAAAPNSRSQQ